MNSPFIVTATGAIVAEGSDPTFEQWREATGCALQAGRSIGWVIGDLINYAETRWGEKYKEAIELTGLDYGTLRHYTSTASRVPLCLRNHKLSYYHHVKVAGLKAPEQKRWLELCDKKLGTPDEIGVRRLAKCIRQGKLVPKDEAVVINQNRGIPNHLSQITRLVAWWRNFDGEDRNKEQLEALWADFQPLFAALGQIAVLCGYHLTVEPAEPIVQD